MQNLQLSQDEAETLREVLHQMVADMDLEVLRTDTRDYKAMLKQRRALLQDILQKRSPSLPPRLRRLAHNGLRALADQ